MQGPKVAQHSIAQSINSIWYVGCAATVFTLGPMNLHTHDNVQKKKVDQHMLHV